MSRPASPNAQHRPGSSRSMPCNRRWLSHSSLNFGSPKRAGHILRIIRFFLDYRCKIRDRLVPLVESNLSIAAELVSNGVIGLELHRLANVGQRLVIILLQERNLSPPDVSAFIFRRQLNGLGKIGGCFWPFFQRDIRKAAILIKRRLFAICFDCFCKLRDRLFVLLAFKKLVTLCVLAYTGTGFLFGWGTGFLFG